MSLIPQECLTTLISRTRKIVLAKILKGKALVWVPKMDFSNKTLIILTIHSDQIRAVKDLIKVDLIKPSNLITPINRSTAMVYFKY